MTKPRARASDAQRTAVQQALDDGFAAGRLDHFEHFERTRTATRAKYVDDLRPLIADLRGGDDPGLGLGEEQQQEPGRSEWPRPRWRRRGIVAGLAASVITLALIGGAVFASVSDSSSSNSQPAAPGPLHTLDGLTRLIESAKTEFADHDIDSLLIHGNHASIMYADPGEPGQRLTHMFQGQWEERRSDPHTSNSTFPLEAVDPATVFTVIDAAPAALDLDDDVVTSHVQVSPDPLGDPEYRVSISEGADGDLGTAVFSANGEVREVQEPR